MIEFQRPAIKCIFDRTERPSARDPLYYFLVAIALGSLSGRNITLDDFKQTSTSRSMTFKDQEGNTLNLHHSWRRDGTETKPETYWNERSLGRFAIWGKLGNEDITKDQGPWGYAEDLYDIENK